MTSDLLNQIITHLVVELRDAGASVGKTKLVKLLYLIDVENWRRRQKTLTGLEWQFYHYGPYAFEIDDALEELAFDIPQESFSTERGDEAFSFRADWGLRSSLGKVISLSELHLVNRVIQEWGETELNPLLNHVYFYTEPMRDAKRGDILDFSTVQPPKRKTATYKRVPMPADRLAEYRARFQEAKSKRVRRPLIPAPRYDKVYWDAVARMNAEDRPPILPPGIVEISEEAKRRLRGEYRN